MKHVGIEIKFYNLDTFIKQIDVNFIDFDSKLVDLNYKVASLIFCQFWRSILSCIGDDCVYHLQEVSGKSRWKENGTRLFG